MFKQFVLPVFALTLAFAQPPGMGPGRGMRMGPGPGMGMGASQNSGQSFTEIKTYLSLSDTQLTSITSAARATVDANQTLMQSLRQKQQALQTLLDSGSTDAAAIGRAMIEIRDLRKQATSTQAKLQEQVLSFLTADQKTKLKALEDAEKPRPAIGQANALHLLAPPANAGPGPRGFGPFGPAGFAKDR